MTTYTLQQVRDHCHYWLPWALPTLDAAIAREAELRAKNEMLKRERPSLERIASSLLETTMAQRKYNTELERELAAWRRAVHQECGTTFVIQADGCERTSESRITTRVAELLAAPAAAQEGTNA